MYRILVSASIVLFPFFGITQQSWSKSELLHALAKELADSTRTDIYNELSWPIYSYGLPDSSIYYGEKAINLSEKINDTLRLLVAHRRIGITFSNIGNLKKAIFHQEESFRLSDEIKFERGKYLALNNIGVAYLNSELVSKALSYFLKSLTYVENSDDYGTLSKLYSNCGTLYRRTGNKDKAIDFFLKASYFAELTGDADARVTANCNLSTSYRTEGKIDSARHYISKAKEALVDEVTSQTKYTFYLTEALLHVAIGEHALALVSLEKTKPFVSGLSDEITWIINVADQYKYLKEFAKARKYYEEAFELSKKNRMYDNLQYITLAQAKLYESTNNLIQFAAQMKLYVAYRDSNEKFNKAQELLTQQLEFDYERKHVADSVRFEQKDKLNSMELEVAESRLEREKLMRLLLICVLLMLLVVAVFINNRLRLTRRQKEIIEEQKQIVELKNQEILDSIHYAKHLQEAILPPLYQIKKYLNFEIFYRPKDIIGGDFYFFDKYHDKIYIAVCDCTGHGIPGAIMSVVCHNALTKSIREFNLSDPALILNKARQIIIESLNAAEQNIRDGMDCSLLVVDGSLKTASWAGAYNPLWILRANQITEIKAEKQSVSFYENQLEFKSHHLQIQKGDIVYLFSDGYADQFGGERGKKYKYKPLKELLIKISDKSQVEQNLILEQNFDAWKGHLDQVDDVAIAILKF